MATKLGNIFATGSGGGGRGAAVYTGHGPLTSNPPDAQDLDLYFDVDEYTWTVITVGGSTGPTGPTGPGTPTGWRYSWNPSVAREDTPGLGAVGRTSDNNWIIISKQDADGNAHGDTMDGYYNSTHQFAFVNASGNKSLQVTIAATGNVSQSGFYEFHITSTGTVNGTFNSAEDVYLTVT